MSILSVLSKYREKRIEKTCRKIYEKAKKMKPNKSERELLKIVLITKPPFDYQHDKVINSILDSCENIHELSDIISEGSKINNSFWITRERNIKNSNLKERNQTFFREFWG
jgi:Na+/phosphate symporter